MNSPIHRTSKIPPAFRIILSLVLFSLVAEGNNALAQTIQAASSCVLSGTDTVMSGSTATYSLGPCTATNWTASCGTISNQAATTATLNFAGAACGSVTIIATKGGVTLATKKVTIVQGAALSAGTIDNLGQNINYHEMPQPLNAPLATGGNCGGLYTYQWLSSVDSINYLPIAGATTQNYQPGPLTATTYYKRQTNCGGSAHFTTNAVKVTVYPAISGLILSPATQSVNYTTAPATISLGALAASNGNFSYQWQSSSDGSFTGVTATGGTNTTSYSPGTLNATTYFRVAMIRNGDSIFSNPAIVNVLSRLTGGSLTPSTQTVASDSVCAVLSLAGVTGGDGNYSYQWFSSTDANNWSPIDGVTSPDYGPGLLETTTYFRVVVSSKGLTAICNNAVIKIN